MADQTPGQAFFRSGGKVYELVEQDQVSLRDVVTFPRDSAKVLGEPMTWAQFEALTVEMSTLSEPEQAAHPLSSFVLAVSIWSSRRAAGDKVTFDEVLDEPFEWVEVATPQDHKPGKRQGAKKAPGKRAQKRSRPATRTSGPDGDSPAQSG